MVSENDKLVEGTKDAGIYDNGSTYYVRYNGDEIGLAGRDISSARKVLAEKRGK